MPPATGGIVGGTGETQQHVAHHARLPRFLCARDLKRRIAVMQKGDVIHTQRMTKCGHPLMAGGADGIEPLPPLLHRAAFNIQGPRQHLRAVEIQRGRPTQRPRRAFPFGKIPCRHTPQKVLVHDLNPVQRPSP